MPGKLIEDLDGDGKVTFMDLGNTLKWKSYELTRHEFIHLSTPMTTTKMANQFSPVLCNFAGTLCHKDDI